EAGQQQNHECVHAEFCHHRCLSLLLKHDAKLLLVIPGRPAGSDPNRFWTPSRPIPDSARKQRGRPRNDAKRGTPVHSFHCRIALPYGGNSNRPPSIDVSVRLCLTNVWNRCAGSSIVCALLERLCSTSTSPCAS